MITVVKNTLIQRQTERLKRGEINRRRFIMSALATGVTLPTATSLAQRAQASQPKTGGTVRIAVADPTRLSEMRALATGNTLLEVGTDGQLTGDLAAAFEQDRNGQRIRLELRDDVGFHDGSALDAPTVVSALSKADTPGIRGQIKTLRADGPNTVLIDLIHPNVDFAWALTDPALTIRNARGAATGAYVAVDDRRLEKHDAYWKSGRGHFDSVDLIPLPGPAARLTALLNAEVDMMEEVDPAMVALLDHTPEIELIGTKAAALYGFAPQTGADPYIGRHMLDAEERRDLAGQVLLGHGHARGCATCPADAVRKEVTFAPAEPLFPGSREMVSAVAKLAERRGHTVSIRHSAAHLKTERVRMRPTLDWTLSEIAAQRPDTALGTLIHKVRATTSLDEKSALQEKALVHLERQGHLYPLIADALYAHRSSLTFPGGTFDPLRIAERGWLV